MNTLIPITHIVPNLIGITSREKNRNKFSHLSMKHILVDPTPLDLSATMKGSIQKPKPYQFLVVDDNPIIRKTISILLTKDNNVTHVDFAENGEEALSLIQSRKNSYDCILLDNLMPRMSGPECSKLIRSHEQKNNLPRAPIICLSGNSLSKEQLEMYGMNAFLLKPVSYDQLWQVLSPFVPNLGRYFPNFGNDMESGEDSDSEKEQKELLQIYENEKMQDEDEMMRLLKIGEDIVCFIVVMLLFLSLLRDGSTSS